MLLSTAVLRSYYSGRLVAAAFYSSWQSCVKANWLTHCRTGRSFCIVLCLYTLLHLHTYSLHSFKHLEHTIFLLYIYHHLTLHQQHHHPLYEKHTYTHIRYILYLYISYNYSDFYFSQATHWAQLSICNLTIYRE